MEALGFNYRITDFQAALGLSQLKKINRFKNRRREIVSYYNKHFSGIEELILPYEDENVDSNFHLYSLQVNKNSRFDRYDLFYPSAESELRTYGALYTGSPTGLLPAALRLQER
jgi:dTDP-4-amino-4,6-dideoxygalactose transaminase